MANIQSIITYNANLSPAQAQIKALTGQVAGLTTAFNALDKSALKAQSSLASTFMANVGQIGGFRSEIVQINSGVEQFGKNLAAQRLTMRQYFREAIAGYTKQNSLMKQLAMQQVAYQQAMAIPLGGGRAAIITPTNMSALANSAAMASAKFSIFNELIQGASTRLLNFGKNTQWTGRQLMVGFTVPMAMFTVLLSKQFRDMDRELVRFQKVYGADLGNTVKSTTEMMTRQVEELAYSIARTYGVAAKETAALAADIAATGREGEELIASIQQTTRLAVLGEVDRQEAMKTTLSLQSAFKQDTDELAESINFLNAVENQTSATLQDLATAIPKVGPVIQSLGGNIEDLAVLLVAMREGGVPAAEAANALKSGLASLINPTAKAADVAKKFGVNLIGIVEANRGQLMPTITALQDALQGLDDFSRARIIEEIFGKFQFARISALFANLGKAGSQTTAVLDLASKSSVELAKIANDELRTLQESTSMRFQRTLENLKSSLIPLGEILTESIIPIFQFIGSGIGKFVEFFQALPEPVKNFAKYGLLITALAGPVVMLIGLFGNLIANGIKFSMAIVRIGAKLAGLKFEKFQLLDATAAAARMNIDNLTTSFSTQERALNRLQGVLATYVSSLRTLAQTNPALFIPGAMGAKPAPVPSPIRRQMGSRRPEKVPGGYGGGDTIPALLEPGEFVVRKEAASKYGSILMSMNRGDLKGFSNGTPSSSDQYRGSAVRRNKASIGVPYAMGPNAAAAGIAMPFGTLGPTPGNLLGLFYKDIARAAGVSLTAIVRETQAWQLANKDAIIKFTKVITSSTASTAEKAAALSVIEDKFVKDMSQAKGATSKFAQEAARFEKENSVILKRAQTILTRHNVDLTDAASITNFYKNNLVDLSKITDKTELAAMQLLKNTLTAGSYKKLTPVVSAALPLMLSGQSTANRMQTYAQTGYPIQYIPPAFRDPKRERSAMGLGFTRQVVVAGRELSMSTEHVVNTLNQIASNSAKDLSNLSKRTMRVAQNILKINSPSREIEAISTPIGVGIAQGAINGLRRGMSSVATTSVSPVGVGLEGRSLRSQIATKEQSILKFTEIQEKAARNRTIAEGQIVEIQKAISRTLLRSDISIKERLTLVESLKAEILQQKAIIQSSTLVEKRASDNVAQAKNDLAALIRKTPPPGLFRSVSATGGTAGTVSGIVVGGGVTGIKTATRNTIPISSTGKPLSPRMTISGPQTSSSSTTSVGRSGTVSVQGLSSNNRPSARTTGPTASIRSAQQSAGREMGGMRGMGAMNAIFAMSMLTSSISMMGGASADAAAKLGLFTTALMTATLLMNTGITGKGVFTNFLGMRSLGGKLAGTNAARLAANPALAQRASSVASAGGLAGGRMAGQGAAAGIASSARFGGMLLGASRVLSVLGGPIGIGVGLAVTGAVTAFMLYKKAAEEARARAIGAFEEPTKAAEYFGVAITDVASKVESANMSALAEDLGDVDQALRDAVKEDYGPLIERLKNSSAEAGAFQLSLAFSNMIASGLSAEQARAAIEAIAVEAGESGGLAFAEAAARGMLKEMTPGEAVRQATTAVIPTTNIDLVQEEEANIEDLKRQKEILEEEERRWQSGGYDPVRGSVPPPPGQRPYKDIVEDITEIEDKLAQAEENLRQLSEIDPSTIMPLLETLLMAYDSDPAAVAESLGAVKEAVEGMSEAEKAVVERDIATWMEENNPEQWAIYKGEIDTAEEALAAMAMTVAGIPLSEAADGAGKFNLALAEAALEGKVSLDLMSQELDKLKSEFQEKLILEIDADIEVAEKRLRHFQRRLREIENNRQRSIDSINEEREAAQKASEAAIEGLQKQSEALQKLIDERRKETEEKIESLEEEKEQINDSTDAYLKSIQKRQRADNFYADQRKTALGGLKALAEGDVFGFLEARQEMSAAAQDFAYENEIERIEAVRDAENERIDDLIEKEQEQQKRFEENQQKKIDAIQEQIDKQQEAQEAMNEYYDAEIDRVNEAADARIEAVNKSKRAEENTLTELRDLKESIAAGELVSAEKLAEALGEERAKPYIEEMKAIIRASVARDLTDPTLTEQDVYERVKALYIQLFGSLPTRSSGLGIEDILKELGLPYPLTKPPAPPVPGGDTRAASGGYISGPGGPKTDSIPARLSNGEYVVQASSVKKYGVPLMNAINEAKFAKGGYVGFATGGSVDDARDRAWASRAPAPTRAPTPAPNNYGFGSGYGYRAPTPAPFWGGYTPAPNNYGYGSGYGGYSPTTNRTSNTTNNTAAPAVKMVYHPILGYVPEAVASSYSSQRTTSYKSYYNNNNFGFGWGYGSGATKETPNNFGFSNNTPIVNNFGFGIGFGSKELPVDTFGFKNSYGPSRFTMVDHPVLGKVPAIVAAQYNNSVNNPGPSFTDIFRSVDPFRQGQERRDEEKAIRDERDRLVSLMAQYDVATTEEKYRMNINYPDLNRRINELNDQLGEGGTVGSFLGDMWQATREDFAAYLSVQPQVALAVALTGQKETADKALSSIAGLSEEEWTQRSGWENVVGALMFGSNFIPIPGFAAIKAAVTAGRAGIKTAASSGLRQGVKSIIPAYQTAKQAAAKGVASTMLGIDVATGGLGRNVDNLRGGAVKSSTPSKVISAEDVTRSNIQEQINAVRETFRASRTMPKQPRPIDDATLARSVSEHISQKDWDDLLQFSNENGMSWDDIVSTIKTNPEKLTEDGSAVLTLIRNFYEHRASLVKQAQENSPKYQELSALNQAKAKEFRRSFNERWKELYGDSTPFELPEPTDISLSLYDDLLSTMSREEAMGKLAIVMSEVFGGDMSKLVPILKKSTDRASSQYKKYGYDNSPATFSSFSELMQSAAPEKIFQYHYGVDPLLLLDEMAYRKTLLNTKMDASGATAHIESTRAVMYNLDSTYKNLAEESSLIAARTIYPGINWTLDTPIQVTKGWSGFMPIPDGDFRHVANLKRSDRVALHEGAHPEAAGVGGWSRQAKLIFGSPEQFSPFAEAGWTAPGRLKWGGTPADTSRPITLTQRLHDSHTTDEFVLDLLDNEVAKSFSSTGLNIIPALGHAYSWMNPRTAGYWSYNPQNAFLGMYADPNFGLMGYSSKTLGLGDAAMNSAQGSVQLRKTFGTLGLGPEQELLIPPSFIDNLLNVKGPTKNLNTEDLLEKRGTIHREVMQTSAYTNSGARRFKYSPTPQTISQQEYDRFMRMLDEYVQYGDKFGGPRFTKEQLLEAINIEKNSSGRYTVSGNVHYLNYLGKDLLDRISTLHEAKEFISQEFYGRGIISAETAQQVAQEVNEDFWRSRIASLKAQSGMPFNPDDLSSRELMNLISSQEMEIFSKALADPYSLGNYSSESIRDAVGVIESMLGKQLYVDTSFSSNYRLWKSGLYAPKDENELQAFIALSAAEGVTIPSWPGVGSFEMPQKYAEGGLVESMKKWFPNGNHNFYPGWSKWTSWDKGKPQLVTMHHTALPDGVSQRQELDSIAKNWKGKPVVQAWLGKSGEAWTLAAGDTGYGHGIGTTKYMKGDLEQAKEIIDIAGHPNRVSWQMEVSSAGKVKDFTSSQFDSIARMTAAIREWAGWPTFQGRIIQHKDWAGYRTDGTARVDTLYPTSVFTQNAEKVWREGGGSSDTGAGTGGGDSSDNPSGDSITGRTIPSSAIGRIGFRALPRFITGAMLPSVQKPPPSDSGGAGDGEPIFDENRLKNLGYSLATAKKTLAHVEAGNWPRQWHRLAWTIAMRESGGDVSKIYKGKDYGLFQLNKPSFGNREWWDNNKLLQGDYNSSMAFKHVSDNADTFLPWAMMKSYDGTSAGFNWSMYDGRPWFADATEKRTNDLWPTFLGYRDTSDDSGGGGGDGSDSSGSNAGQKAVDYSRTQLGKPYSFSANPPNSWDCSTLTAWAWAVATGGSPQLGWKDNNAAVKLTPYSHTQANQLRKRTIGLQSGQIQGLAPGDILYFRTEKSNEQASGGHTSIYAGSGQVIQASTPSTGVIISSLNSGWNTGINNQTGQPRFQWAGPPIGYAAGGFVSGPGTPTSDSIPAVLSNGEYVVRASSVKKYGKGMMDAINSGQISPQMFGMGGSVKKYAVGGLVGSMPQSLSYNMPTPQEATPSFNMPSMAPAFAGGGEVTNMSSIGGSTSSNNSSSVKIVINGVRGKDTKTLAKQVAQMIRNSDNRRDHSRSIG